jgi:hypothetical protein
MKNLIFVLILCIPASCQLAALGAGGAPASGFTAISLDATCNGTGSATPTACSSPMTVTSGDTIVCEASGNGFDPESLYFNDTTNNKFYDNVAQVVHSNNANTAVATAVLANSTGGSITPQVNNFEAVTLNIKCSAFKGTRTTQVLDGGAVNQTNRQTTAAANPTSGTAASPTNNNETVIGAMVRPTTATTSDSAPWVPGSTITAVGSSYPIYDHYQIQTSATSANSPMTSSSVKYVDTQLAILNSSNSAGYRALTGLYGPTTSRTNGASLTAADLNSNTAASTLTDGGWQLTGTAGTYDTSFAPTGTGSIMVNGSAHTFGDAATGMTLVGARQATQYAWTEKVNSQGTPRWLSLFFQLDSAGVSSGQFCDAARLLGGVTDQGMTLQALYTTGNGVYFFLEPFESGGSALLTGFSLDTPYWIQVHAAGVNERFNDIYVSSKSGSTWSQVGHLQYDLLCVAGGAANATCNTPPTAATTTGTGSGASTTLTISSGTGTANGQTVTDPVNGCLPWPTLVESGGGTTSITLSQKPTCSISSTVNFYAAQPNLDAATIGTASSGSTALTVTAPGTGTINVGDLVGGTGIANGTFVAGVTGTAVTLSQPTNAAVSAGVSFWSNSNVTEGEATFGKFSSCTVASSMHFAGFTYDPLGTWGNFEPN